MRPANIGKGSQSQLRRLAQCAKITIMKKFFALASALDLIACQSLPNSPGSPRIVEIGGIPAGYALVWSDEFNIDGLPDSKKWQYDYGQNKDGWYNNEKQYYSVGRAKNSRVENGKLIIEAHKEDLSEFSDWGGQKYSSARIHTDNILEFTYGFVEVRAKLPCQIGSWPAIWTLFGDEDYEWPEGGEIDIMEHTGSRPGTITQTTHTKNYHHAINTQKSVDTLISDACETFHNYQMLWTKDYVKMGVDGNFHFIYRNFDGASKADWPFSMPQFLIINLAIGGDFTGKAGIDDNGFPSRFEIDYVRVYQPK